MDQPRREPLIEELYEPTVVRAFTAPASSHLIDELRAEERAAIGAMVANRRAEFATARACARSAIAEFGIDAAIPRSDGGAPRWPIGITGSISHTRGFCVAVATDDGHAIGIDVEEVDRMSAGVERRILVDHERDALAGLDQAARRDRVATIFAAKEAFYKAHYQLEARYLGFDAVAVSVVDSVVRFAPASGAVGAEILEQCRGRFRIDVGRVMVGVSIGASGSDRPLPSTG